MSLGLSSLTIEPRSGEDRASVQKTRSSGPGTMKLLLFHLTLERTTSYGNYIFTLSLVMYPAVGAWVHLGLALVYTANQFSSVVVTVYIPTCKEREFQVFHTGVDHHCHSMTLEGMQSCHTPVSSFISRQLMMLTISPYACWPFGICSGEAPDQICPLAK